LGEGAFSVVIEATKKGTAESYAVKVVTKAKLTREDEIALVDEINILTELKHKHIIRLYDVFDEKAYWYLITEIMTGGELFDRIVSKAFYNEKEARDVCKILFEAIGFCHSKSVCHRDLKPENLLLRTISNDSDIKIADFGFAKKVLTPNSLTTQCGTPGYVAPEILEGVSYDIQSDMWSLGVIIYIILGGYPPFIEQNQRELFRKIRRGQYEFHEEYWGSVSTDAKDMIKCLLTVQPAKRMTANQALQHKWMLQDDSILAAQDLGTNLSELRKYNAKRKFKAAVNVVSVIFVLCNVGDRKQHWGQLSLLLIILTFSVCSYFFL
jgi:serine/threonine protein kinase